MLYAGGSAVRISQPARAISLSVSAFGVMLDDEDADVFEFGDAMRRPRAELLGGGEDDTFLAGRQQRALESGVRQFVGADARRGGNRAGSDEAEVDVHLRDAQSRERVDTPADVGVSQSIRAGVALTVNVLGPDGRTLK
jgi:hypothetical protein